MLNHVTGATELPTPYRRLASDVNRDGEINALDLINIGTAANPIWVPPTGVRHDGLLYSPAILTIPGTGTDVLHFSTSGGNLESEIAITEKTGFLYWRTW